MKNLYLTLSMLAAATVGASAANHVNFQPVQKQLARLELPAGLMQTGMTQGKLPVINGIAPRLAKSEEIVPEEVNFLDGVYTSAQMWYYGDMLYDGTGFYLLVLSDCGLDQDGLPEGEGHMVRFFLHNEAPMSDELLLPAAGEYVCDNEFDFPLFSLYPTNCTFFDCFYMTKEGETAPTLMAYAFEMTDGKVSFEYNESMTHMTGSFDMTGENFLDDQVALYGQMTGTFDCDFAMLDGRSNPSEYPAYEGDFSPALLEMNGRYMDMGGTYDYTMTFYNVPLDEDGFIIGAGDLLNVDLMAAVTDEPLSATALCGTYQAGDMMTDYTAFDPGHFLNGMWYPITSDWYAPMCTACYTVDEYGEYVGVGLGVDGTIVVTSDELGYLTFDFDLITPENTRITASWTGEIVDNSEAQGEGAFLGITHDDPVAIQQVQGNDAQRQIYDLQGRRQQQISYGQTYVVNGKVMSFGR